MSQHLLDQIPRTILQSVTRHLEAISACNADVLRARGLARMVGSLGRYKRGYRLAHAPQAQASSA